MKILVATGSFKDVYSPLEAAEVITSALNAEKNEISSVPFCDGGEYTYEVLCRSFGYEEVTVANVLNPYGVPCVCRYLRNGEEAHIVSSCIIRLYPEEDAYKNPLQLTDYGFGQLIADAIQKGCTKLTLYIGGTSTVCCGMGTIQALGAKLYDTSGNLLTSPCTGADLEKISRIVPPDTGFGGVSVHIVGDGNSKVDALPGITALKVGKTFSAQKEAIVTASMRGIRNIVRLTGISPEKDFTGAAGGILFGLEQLFENVRYTLGGLYFNEVLGIEEHIRQADLVITGEGRYDNTADGKAPSVIASLAKKCGKPAILVCGQIEKTAMDDYSGGIVDCQNHPQFLAQGITKLFTCQEFYDSFPLPDTYQASIHFFREKTPLLMKELFAKAGL